MEFSRELWNILPYTGISGNYSVTGTITDFLIPETPKTKLVGISSHWSNENTDSSLKLVLFTSNIKNGSIRLDDSNNSRLFIADPLLEYTISWKIKTFEKKSSIGFYTPNYLANAESNTYALILSSNGPAIYEANECNDFCGSFAFTKIEEMFVVTNANNLVVLTVEHKIPESVFVPKLKLYEPYNYKTSDNILIATRELTDE